MSPTRPATGRIFVFGRLESLKRGFGGSCIWKQLHEVPVLRETGSCLYTPQAGVWWAGRWKSGLLDSSSFGVWHSLPCSMQSGRCPRPRAPAACKPKRPLGRSRSCRFSYKASGIPDVVMVGTRAGGRSAPVEISPSTHMNRPRLRSACSRHLQFSRLRTTVEGFPSAGRRAAELSSIRRRWRSQARFL